MRDKDSQLLSEAYEKIYSEELDPNSYSSAVAHLAIPALLGLYKYLKGHFLTKPRVKGLVKQMFENPDISRDINAYLSVPNVHNLHTLRGAISDMVPPDLVEEVINEIREYLRDKREKHV